MKAAALIGGAALLMLLAWVVWLDGDVPTMAVHVPATTPSSASPKAALPGVDQPGSQWMSALPGAAPESAPGWASLAEGRELGESRTPPLHRPSPHPVGASPAQLADPAAYRAYERGEHARTLAAFAAAAQTQAALLRADVAQARAIGIDPAEILKVEQKIQRLDAIRRGIEEQGKVPSR